VDRAGAQEGQTLWVTVPGETGVLEGRVSLRHALFHGPVSRRDPKVQELENFFRSLGIVESADVRGITY
jgi:hypothetical protein